MGLSVVVLLKSRRKQWRPLCDGTWEIYTRLSRVLLQRTATEVCLARCSINFDSEGMIAGQRTKAICEPETFLQNMF